MSLHAAVPTGDITVMIIRHAEKPDSRHPGIAENGHPDQKSLTRRGWDRARALHRLFSPAPGHPLPSGLDRPRSIFAAADQGPHAGSHRMLQTVTFLARHMGLKVDTSYAETHGTALAAAALAAPGPVLICWEHTRIPDIVHALGAAGSGAPRIWPDRFDLVWVLTRTDGTWSFQKVHQHLLPGDA